jgi:hypothetical protein
MVIAAARDFGAGDLREGIAFSKFRFPSKYIIDA